MIGNNFVLLRKLRGLNLALWIIVFQVSIAGCEHVLNPGTIIQGQVVIEGSNEVVNNAAIIIWQSQVFNTTPQNSISLITDTILCNTEGYFYHQIERLDSATEFSFSAARWDSLRQMYVQHDCICSIGEWRRCNSIEFGDVYENYIVAITDSE